MKCSETDCYHSTNEQSHLNVICPQQNDLNYTVPELPRPVQQSAYYARNKCFVFLPNFCLCVALSCHMGHFFFITIKGTKK